MAKKPGLLIAPNVDDISWTDELLMLTDKYPFKLLAGDVTVRNITRETDEDQFDVVHFLGHVDEHGARLSNGELWPVVDMVGTVRHVDAQLVYINGCTSSVPGNKMKIAGVPGSICWANDVIDERALRVASYYYEKLRELGDYHEAFEAVDPRDGTFVWFANGKYRNLTMASILERLNCVDSRFKWFAWALVAVAFMEVSSLIVLVMMIMKW